MLLTPEEYQEPRVLRQARHAAAEVVAAGPASLQAAVVDPATHARVLAASPRRTVAVGEKAAAEARLVERALRDGPAALAARERLRLLSSRSALVALHREVLAQRAHPEWMHGARIQRTAWIETLPPDAAERAQADPADRLATQPS